MRILKLLVLCLPLLTSGALAAQPVERVNVGDLGRLPAFSHATVSSTGLIFVSGTLGTKPGELELVDGGAGPETTQILDNIASILDEAGSSLENLLKCTVFLTDLGDFAAMNEAWVPRFAGKPPARAAVGVADLVLGAAVEIECVGQRGRQ